MLKRIVIKQLFWKYDYDLNFENDDRLTIIISLNNRWRELWLMSNIKILRERVRSINFIRHKSFIVRYLIDIAI